MSALTDSDRIAKGLAPKVWEQTFEHPKHGPLTFTAQMPKAMLMAEHSVEIDNRLANLTGEARAGTMILVAALAGLTPVDPDKPGKGLLVNLPAIGREEVADDEKGSVKVITTYYDAEDEEDVGFLTEVWVGFSMWRSGLLQEVDAVKGSSGETSGSGSSSESAAPTASPSTTLV